jgi:hypothetical protein
MKKKQKKADRETGESGTADNDDDGPPQGEGEHDETCSEIVLYDKELAKKAYERYVKISVLYGFLFENSCMLTYSVPYERIRIRSKYSRKDFSSC